MQVMHSEVEAKVTKLVCRLTPKYGEQQHAMLVDGVANVQRRFNVMHKPALIYTGSDLIM